MDIKINIVEAAAEIAEREITKAFGSSPVEEGEDGVFVYTKEGQEAFENSYDEIFDILLNCKTIENDKNTD